MDFVTGLPRTQNGFDAIWVVIDRLTKVALFIPVKTTFNGRKLAELYISRIVCPTVYRRSLFLIVALSSPHISGVVFNKQWEPNSLLALLIILKPEIKLRG